MKAQWASLAALAVALIVAIAVYSMPAGQAFDSAAEGAVFGFWPIMWIVINAIWIFKMTEVSGYFAVLRRAFAQLSDDSRIQVIVIAFCFGSLLEALAGFGTPVAICASILVGLGVSPLRAAAVTLVADTAPVAFGAIAIPITTLGTVTGLPVNTLGAMVGRQCPIMAFFIPFVLVFMTDGRRGLRHVWPACLTAGLTFGIVQFAVSNYVSVPLTDILASFASAAALVALLRVWTPPSITEAASPGVKTFSPIAGAAVSDPGLERKIAAESGKPISRADTLLAFAPYAIITIVLGVTNFNVIHDQLIKVTTKFSWPGLHVLSSSGATPDSVTFSFEWLAAAGTGLLLSGILTALVFRMPLRQWVSTYIDMLKQLKWALVVVSAVLAVAYVMNLSGQTATLGTWAAGAGGVFAFLSPIIGWFGTAVTGSDTSTNSLFGALQVAAAHKANLSPTLLAAANSTGGVMGKMVSPQNLAIGASAVGLAGREGEIFRQVIGWSILLICAVGVLVLLQSTGVLSWMVP